MEDKSETKRSYYVSGALRAPRIVSAACLVMAATSFVGAWVLAYVAAPEVVEFFYQPHVLAIVHTLTLGWISLTMMGVLYQFVPALTKHPVSWSGGAVWQVLLFATGSLGMVVSFWFGRLEEAAWSATAVAIATLLFAAQLAPGLVRAPRVDGTVLGILCALGYFAATALLGMLYAWDKVHPFLAGSVLSNIAGHAHLGLIGWISLTICAVSYKIVTAFLLPTEPLPRSARRQILSLAALVPLLAGALLLRSRWAVLPAVGVSAAMLWYGAILATIARTRRMPIDWAMRHVVAALLNLFAALLCGLLLFVVDPSSAFGTRLAAVYGLLLLVGWISNYIVGIGSRMAPGIMGLGGTPLLSGHRAALVFVLLNGGIVAVAASLLAGSAAGLRLSVLVLLCAALLFIASLVMAVSGRHASPKMDSRDRQVG